MIDYLRENGKLSASFLKRNRDASAQILVQPWRHYGLAQSRQILIWTHDEVRQHEPELGGGVGASVCGGHNQSNVRNDYARVQEQSGIRAGDGGFHVAVGGNTELKGGMTHGPRCKGDFAINPDGTGAKDNCR